MPITKPDIPAKKFCFVHVTDVIITFKFHEGGSSAKNIPIVMRYGRKDCDGNPREKAEDFPNNRMGLQADRKNGLKEGVLEWCRRVFSFTTRECVAIMGKLLRLSVP